MPEDVLLTRRPFEVEIVYKAEALLGEELLIRVEFPPPGGAGYIHEIVNRETGVELARLKTSWR